jgi:hypothetical protein
MNADTVYVTAGPLSRSRERKRDRVNRATISIDFKARAPDATRSRIRVIDASEWIMAEISM